MASTEWNEVDSQQYQFENYYCVFLDILGYKDKLARFFRGEYNLCGRVQRAMHYAEVRIHDSPDGIKTRTFSDSIILTAPEKVEIGLLINYTAAIVAWFSYEGLFLRGGISAGRLLENDADGFLASEGLVNAYKMETEATYPMIVIDTTLVSKIDKKYIVKFGEEHSGCKYILNYARYVINEFAKNENDVVSELKDISKMIIKPGRDTNNSTNPTNEDERVRRKYKWILSYYLWFIEMCNKDNASFDMDKFLQFNRERDDRFIFMSI